jgi:cilia- and flagella-associated protein 44
MLKFGRVIDLDILDRLGPTPGAEELRAQLKEQEKRFTAELRDWDRKIAARTEELVALTEENTTHLNTVAELTAQQKFLEQGMRRTQADLDSDPISLQQREMAERDHLIKMVNSQSKEIQYLKSQIDILKRKDTNVYG